MKSLSGRLLAGILFSIAAFWIAWLFVLSAEASRRETGWVDSSLRDTARQVVVSLPIGLSGMAEQRRFSLPADEMPGADRTSFQVWSLPNRQLLLRSPDSPATPLKGNFEPGFADGRPQDNMRRVYALSDASGAIQVQVGKSRSMIRREVLRANRGLWVASLVFLLLAGAVWLAIRWSLTPVTRLSGAIQRRGATDLTPLPVACLPGEVAPLIQSFNRLLARLDAAMRAERQFLADAAHELRTPLATLIVQAELARRAGSQAQARQELDKLVLAAQRGARLSEQLLDMARLDGLAEPAGPQPVALHTLVSMLVRDVDVVAAQKAQRIELEARPCAIDGHVDPLGVLIRNLIDNALRYAGRGARIAVSCHMHEAQGGRVLLRVADDGPGVPEAERERIFDRFYRLAGGGERGSGIGLSLVAQTARLHGAVVEAGPGLDGRGFGVNVWFPARAA